MKTNGKSVARSIAFYLAAALSIPLASSGVAQQISNTPSAPVVLLPKNVVITTIPLGVGTSPTRIGVTPNGHYVYVAQSFSNNVSVISASTNTVTATIAIGADTFSVAVSPDGTTVYVGGYVANSIWVISTATNTITNTISLPLGAWPHGLAITPDGTKIYAAAGNIQALYIIDASSLAIVKTIDIAGLDDVRITPDGTSAYVSSSNGSVDQIDTASQTIGKTNLGAGKVSSPWALAINPKSANLYVANFLRTVVRINPVTGNSKRFAVMPKQHPKNLEWLGGLTVTPNGKFLYVVNQNLNQVLMVETKHHQVIGSPIPMGEFADPYDVVVSPNGNTLYVVNRNANDVAVVDISPE